MSFPAFEPGRRKVLFFSRGRGSGHAVADIQIGRELAQVRSEAEIRFVSYGAGARTFEAHGIPVIDLGLPDANSIAATTVLAGRVIGRLQPELVLAHEEFSALPAAKIFGIPTACITDYFDAPGTFSMESLWFADRVLFLDRKGVFREPGSARGRTRYLGPLRRAFQYSRADRSRARRELGIGTEHTVIGVFPGSWTEAMAPLLEPLLSAFDGARLGTRHLIWLAGEDVDVLRAETRKRRDVTVLGRDWQIDRLMVACDLAITKANRMTVRELAMLGIRTLSISYGLNAPDDAAIGSLQSNTTIGIGRLTARTLEKALRSVEPRRMLVRSRSCAAEIAEMLS